MIYLLSPWTVYHPSCHCLLHWSLVSLAFSSRPSCIPLLSVIVSDTADKKNTTERGQKPGRGWFFLKDLNVSVQSLFGVGMRDTQLPVTLQLGCDLHGTHIMACSLLTTAGISHERGMQSDAPSLRHFWRVDLFDDPCYVNTQAFQSTHSYAGNQSSTLAQGSPWHLESKCLPTTCIHFLVLWQQATTNHCARCVCEQFPILPVMKVE